MSHIATTWAITLRGLSAGEFRVLMVLADRHNPDHGCFPGQEDICDGAEISRSTLNEILRRLEEKGHLLRRRRGRKSGDGGRLSTRYHFPFEPDFPRLAARAAAAADPGLSPETGHKGVMSGDPDTSGGVMSGNAGGLSPAGRTLTCKKPVRDSKPVTGGPEFAAFWEAWPGAGGSVIRAARAWEVLGPADAEAAIAAAPEWFAAWRAAHPRAAEISAASYLVDQRWRDGKRRADAEKSDPDKVLHKYAEALRQGQAWVVPHITRAQARRMRALDLVTLETLNRMGVPT